MAGPEARHQVPARRGRGTTNGDGLSARHPDSGPVPAEEDAREMAILVLVRLIAEVRKIHTRQTGINATARLYGFR